MDSWMVHCTRVTSNIVHSHGVLFSTTAANNVRYPSRCLYDCTGRQYTRGEAMSCLSGEAKNSGCCEKDDTSHFVI